MAVRGIESSLIDFKLHLIVQLHENCARGMRSVDTTRLRNLDSLIHSCERRQRDGKAVLCVLRLIEKNCFFSRFDFDLICLEMEKVSWDHAEEMNRCEDKFPWGLLGFEVKII